MYLSEELKNHLKYCKEQICGDMEAQLSFAFVALSY